MAGTRFGWVNLVDGATLTAGSELAELPATNLQDPLGPPSIAWQTAADVTTTADGANLIIDAGYTAAIAGFALANSNLSTLAQVLWRVWQHADMMDDSLAYSTGWLNAGVVPMFGQHVHVAPSDVIGRYIRLDLHDPLNPDGHLNVPLIFVGGLWAPTVGMSFSSSFGRVDTGVRTVSRGGQIRKSLFSSARQWTIQMEAIADADVWSRATELDRVARQGGNVLVIPDVESPDINREAILGLLEPTAPLGFSAKSMDARSWTATITQRL